MKNHLLDFCKEFNKNLGNVKEDLELKCVDDGFSKSIKLPQQTIFDDNYDMKYVVTTSLSRLLKTLSQLKDNTEKMLLEEIKMFIERRDIRFGENVDKRNLVVSKITDGGYKLTVSGDYDVQQKYIIDGWEHDFQYLFEGLTLDIEYNNK